LQLGCRELPNNCFTGTQF